MNWKKILKDTFITSYFPYYIDLRALIDDGNKNKKNSNFTEDHKDNDNSPKTK